MTTSASTTPSVSPVSFGSALAALERASGLHADPTTALRETVEALWTIAAQAASTNSGGASVRVELMHRGKRILSVIIRRGLAAGALPPPCSLLAEQGRPPAPLAGGPAPPALGPPPAGPARGRGPGGGAPRGPPPPPPRPR